MAEAGCVVSVVVIGRNEGPRLELCLASVKAVRHPERIGEVIYVDSRSTDGSPARAAALGARVIVLEARRTTAAMGRNAGWRAAVSPFLMFLDGDCVLDPDFIDTALAEFDDPRIAIVWGCCRELHPEASIYQRAMDLDWVYRAGATEFCGGNALVRRRALEAAGGFDAELGAGEEPDLCQRIRAQSGIVLHIDCPMVRHDLAIASWRQYWRRAVRCGEAYVEISRRRREAPMPFWMGRMRRNFLQGGLYFALLLTAPLLAMQFESGWPVAAVAAFFAAITLRSAWLSRWKSRNLVDRLLYAVHSHVVHLPLFVGQLRAWWKPLPKRMAAGALYPAARMTAGLRAGWRRAWSHARLAASIRGGLSPAVVVVGPVEVHGTGRIRIGERAYLYPGVHLETQESGEISIGEGVVLSRGVHITAHARVEIGDGSMVGEYASIRDADHRRIEGVALRESGHAAAPIAIGSQVWIGRGAVVLKGVTIGDFATAGANAVVTHDVARGGVVAGVPARPLELHRKRGERDIPAKPAARAVGLGGLQA